MHRSQSVRQMKVTTDGDGLVSHSGTALLAELADRSGLTSAMSVAMGDCGISWNTHDPGIVLTHLAVAIADGADCLSQLAVLRDQEALFGPVASYATAWRAVQAVASVELRGIDVARASARAAVWAAGGAPEAVTLDFDATLVDAHSDKQDATPTYKRGFGFHPLGVWCDETGEALAAMLRPGNAGANNAADHVKMLDAALAQLPPEWRAGHGRGRRGGRGACAPSWPGPTPPAPPTASWMPWWSATSATPSALTWTIASATPCCWPRRRTGCPPSRATAAAARGHG